MTDPTLCQPLRLAEPITGGPFRRGGRFSPATWRKFSVQLASLIRYMQKHPFYEYGISDQELFKRIMSLQVIPPATVDSTIPRPVSDIICRLLSKQPNSRYRKCSLLIDEVNRIRDLLEVQ